ncbi:MAG: MarR family transcriptional regulator [Desulfobacterales bacterium]|nr:MarR family transcriptional regulator [Desulfobacterales bacterium]
MTHTTSEYIESAFPMLMATAWKQLRESLNKKFTEAGYGVTSEQWGIMVHLLVKDGISQQTLADRYDRSKVAAFKLIEKLEKNHFVTRRSDPDDGRCKLVFLTQKGRTILTELLDLSVQNLEAISQGITEEDLAIFKKVLKRIILNTRP